MKKLLLSTLFGLAALAAAGPASAYPNTGNSWFERDRFGNGIFHINNEIYYGTRRQCDGMQGADYNTMNDLMSGNFNYTTRYCSNGVIQLCFDSRNGSACTAVIDNY